MAAPRLVAALLLVIDFIAAAPLLPNAWQQADRKATAVMALGALVGVPFGTWCLSQFDPVTTRWIISCFVGALLLLLLSGWRYRGKDYPALSVGIGGLAGFCSGLAQTGGPPIVGYWLGRPIASVIARANILLFFGASDFFSLVSYLAAGLVTSDSIRLALLVGPVYAHRRLVRLATVRPRQRDPVPRDLLRPDRCRRDHRPARAGRRAALIRSIDRRIRRRGAGLSRAAVRFGGRSAGLHRGSGRRRTDFLQRGVGGALAAFPGAVDRAPQGFVGGFAGQKQAADRLGQDFARRLAARAPPTTSRRARTAPRSSASRWSS